MILKIIINRGGGEASFYAFWGQLKKYAALSIIIILCAACPKADIIPKADIRLDSDLDKIQDERGWPGFAGYVKNVGRGNARGCDVKIKLYSDTTKSTLIGYYGTRPAFPLASNERYRFEIICSQISSHEDIKSYKGEIHWINEDWSEGNATFESQ